MVWCIMQWCTAVSSRSEGCKSVDTNKAGTINSLIMHYNVVKLITCLNIQLTSDYRRMFIYGFIKFYLVVCCYLSSQELPYSYTYIQGVPQKNSALACCYSGANALFFLGHPVLCNFMLASCIFLCSYWTSRSNLKLCKNIV